MAFDPRRNSLNALRLFFALGVILSHCWPLAGYGSRDLLVGDMSVGRWSVAGFFVISGYLITSSRMGEDSTGRFLWRRALRIYPAFWVVLILTALFAAPLAWALGEPHGHSWLLGHDSAPRYLLNTFTLWRNQTTIAGTPASVPYPGDWNGSLWSLAFEFFCYLLVAKLGATAWLRARRWPVVVTAGLFFVVNLATHEGWVPYDGGRNFDRFVDYGLFFFCGATIWAVSRRIPAHGLLAAGSLAAVVLLASRDLTLVYGGLPLAYLCLWLGARLPLRSVGSRDDISYGVYLYAFPVQQLLAVAGVHEHGFLLYVLACYAVTLPLAWLSCRFVEQPALRLRSWTPRLLRRAVPAPGPGPVPVPVPVSVPAAASAPVVAISLTDPTSPTAPAAAPTLIVLPDTSPAHATEPSPTLH